MQSGFRKPGEFCWFEIMTADVAKSRDFFGKALGWSFVEDQIPGGTYSKAKIGACEIGGFTDLASPMIPKGTPPQLSCYVATADCDKAAQTALANGGKALALPFDVMDYGRMATLMDPTGATFSLWQPKKHKGTEVDAGLHGAPAWFELMTNDVDRGASFYSKVFGWRPEIMQSAPGMKYTTFDNPSAGRKEKAAGMLHITKDMSPMPSHWNPYFTVTDIRKTVQESQRLGAKMVVNIAHTPSLGRWATMTSPDGVTFSVASWD